MKKILFIAGSRGEYGYIRPIINKIKINENLDYEVLITNMHLLSKFGYTKNDFIKDNININYEIYNTLDGYNNITMVKSLSIFLLQIPEILDKSKPDFILISGDRGEQFMAAIAASHMNIPIIHIQAGEKSGNIDGIVRHSITKLSHIHLCSNKDAYDRVIKLGEEKFRVFNTGAPLIDELIDPSFILNNIREILKIDKYKDIFLIVNHSISEEADKSGDQMYEILKALNKFSNVIKIFIMPNSDAGSLNIRKQLGKINSNNLDNNIIYYNLPRIHYINLLRISSIMIGNSSSGIMEAPTFKLPVVNIGRRQIGRYQSNNIINIEKYDCNLIYEGIKKGYTKEFKNTLNNIQNPYGSSYVTDKIIDILENIEISPDLLNKKITY
tara:strand:- start:4580 stop:5731 length:1152 start_codon:yes stop_codon:yes gene_type:complete